MIRLDSDKNGTIIVSDTGPGVHGADRDFIFDPGFTRKPGGRGLGLMISKEILEKNNYELTLANTSKEGATFLIKPMPNRDEA
jgi:signal transduction histidine kinase